VRYFKSWLFDLGLVLTIAGASLTWNVAPLVWNVASVVMKGGYGYSEVSPLLLGVLLMVCGIAALVLGANRVRRSRLLHPFLRPHRKPRS
jgi:hypothetical protein